MNNTNLSLFFLMIWAIATMALWAFAFLPSEQTSPEWLLASRDACFGTLENGLPNGGGWIILIGTPLTLLIATLTLWSQDLTRGIKNIFKSKVQSLCLFVLFSAFCVESFFVVDKIKIGLAIDTFNPSEAITDSFPEHYPRTSKRAYLFSHFDQRNQRLALTDLTARYQVVVLSFAFAQCSTICPMIVNNLIKVSEQFDKNDVAFAIITLDPWRDTRNTIAQWAEQVKASENIYFLTDEVSKIESTLDRYGVSRSRSEVNGDVDHPPLTYIFDRNARIAYSLGKAPTSWLIEAIQRLLNE